MALNRSEFSWALSAVGLATTMLVAPAMAQNTSSSIGGRISGADGQPVVGAMVQVVHTESGSSNTVTTDEQGRYLIRGLRVGVPYVVTVSKNGKSEKREGVYLQLAQTANLDVRLEAIQSFAAVTVTGASASALDSLAMGTGSRFSRQDLEAFGSIKRSLQDYARMDSRFAQTDKGNGEISAAGQNSRFNSITVDSVKINDMFGLEANGLPTLKQPISIDAIQAVQVNISNYDVTQKDYTGANVNAVTKSGTNELSGSVYYVYRDDKLVGDKFSPSNGGTYTKFPAYKEDTKGFTLGGPVVQDKLFFFANYEEFNSTRPQPEFGPVGGSLAAVPISQSAIDQISALAKSKYGIDAGKVGTSAPLAVKDLMLKLDWNISDQHRANIRLASTNQSETIFTPNTATQLSLDSYWWTQKKDLSSVVAQWFADWTPNFSTEFKASNRNYDSEPKNNSYRPSIAFAFSGGLPDGAPSNAVANTTRTLYLGQENSRHINILSQRTQDLYFAGNWVLDDHEVKFGADYSATKTFNAFFQNANGNYTFQCVDSSATYVYSFGFIKCSSATEPQVTQAILENFALGRPYTYQVQIPAPGTTFTDGAANLRQVNTGLFLQDNWAVSDRLKITAGARIDISNLPDKPTVNVAAMAPKISGAIMPGSVTGVRNTGGFGMDNSVVPDGVSLFQPRFGFNYDLAGKSEEKGQVRGGFGLFQGAAPAVWIANPYSNTGVATRIYGCGGSFSACSFTGGVFSADPTSQPTNFTNATPAAGVDYLASDLTQPSVWKMNIAYEGELNANGLTVGAELMLTKTRAGIFYKQLNLGAPTLTGPDGRQLFYTPKGYDPSCWNTVTGAINTAVTGCSGGDWGVRSRALSNASFANVTQATKTDLGGGNTITLSLKQPERNGLGWQVAYTRESATEVSPLTSSVANSNFNSRTVFNPNEEVEANSAYLVKDRITAAVNYSTAFLGNRKTTIGLFYEGRTGKPYSWTFKNDMNGDGVIANDLMYIPKGPGSGEVVFAGATAADRQANEDKFWAIVNANKDLSDAKGGVVSRNGSFSDMVHTFDLRLSQELDGFSPKHKSVFILDIFNVGNLLNKEWGRTNEMLFNGSGGFRRGFVNYAGIDSATGKYIYAVSTIDDLGIKQVQAESQWAVQATFKYEF